ncbi:bifunctional glycosyltransferase family 2 protein/class I SAM-dependent methyltransferase [Clostridium sp. SM-530-WT-3G]|uniref:bifunctional glycosyltransferase family 2 protein/class I SAM-dependent methyltransferase n=1 Tax=Clostridium sp. SM-530-WT-3G TaxID=2725303 RepID=UPI00145E638F|nr:bifunctional glycosyltransferase family 2 protein/class I SAM-dependent methyltransferase [Clostridium sp. SM-530-WT-3G]NME82788.1 glycosyltransferase [Clostridium sp. SM-530-WT-3G]
MNKNSIKCHLENLISNGDLKNAIEIIDQYKKIYGYDDEIGSMEAIVDIYNNKSTDALECIKRGLEFNIYNGDLYYTMGNIYEVEQQYDRAYLCYEHSLLYTENKEKQNIILEAIRNLRGNYNLNVKGYSIIILTYNNLDYTKLCVDSIRKYNGSENCEIIIVDNASNDGTVQWLKQQSDIKYILNNENKGFPAGCNQGIKIAKKDNDIFLLNNDTVIMPNSIFNLRMGLYSDCKVGATGAVSNSISYYQQIDEQYNDFNGYMKFALRNNITNSLKYEERVKLVGFAMFIKRNVLDKVGMLDERFTPGNFEDDDLSLRIIREGYKLLLCKDSYVHHFGSVSFKEKPQQYNELLRVNSNKFKEKWGFSSQYSMNIKKDLISNINVPNYKNIRVLEVGCGLGATLLDIKNRYYNSEVYGIESNPNIVSAINDILNIECGDIENIELKYSEKFFDYIILGNVLERLNNPKEVLVKLSKYLKADGYILASIPNVMHFSVIKDLLEGYWTYQNFGILDKCNLRFFTKNEITRLFVECGYDELNIKANQVYQTESDIEFIKKLNHISGDGVKDQLEAYRYIVKAKRRVNLDEGIVKKCGTLLRRIEFNIDIEETEQEIIGNLNDELFTKDIIIEAVAKYIIDKVYILNYLAGKLIECNMFENVLELLNNAYELNSENIDTNYNIAYFLNMIGEKGLALEYLNKLNITNEYIKELKIRIMEEVNEQ